MAANPAFGATPNCKTVIGSTANTSRTTFTTGYDICTGASGGTRVEGVNFCATGTTTAGVVRVWHYVSSSSTYFLLGEVLVSAVTPSTSIAAWVGSWKPLVGPLILASGDKIGFTTHNAESFTAQAIATDM